MFNLEYKDESHKTFEQNTHWRVIYSDGNFEEKPENYKNIDRTRITNLLIIDDIKGTELLNVPVPEGFQVVARRRTIGGPEGVEKMWIVALIKLETNGVKQKIKDAQTGAEIWDYNQFYQKLHFLHADGKVEIEDDPDEFQKYGKIRDLRDEEVA